MGVVVRLYILRLLYSLSRERVDSSMNIPSACYRGRAIAQLRNLRRRRRQVATEAWNGLKARTAGHHFRSRFRFRVADDPLQGHDGAPDSASRLWGFRVRVSRHSRAYTRERMVCVREFSGQRARCSAFKSVRFNWEQSRRNGNERRDGHWTRQRSVEKFWDSRPFRIYFAAGSEVGSKWFPPFAFPRAE